MTRAAFPREPGQRVVLRVGSLRIAGASRIEAQRLADALPGALAAAIGGPGEPGLRPTMADRVAQQVLAAITSAREGQ